MKLIITLNERPAGNQTGVHCSATDALDRARSAAQQIRLLVDYVDQIHAELEDHDNLDELRALRLDIPAGSAAGNRVPI